jgi:hypothetical protein
VIERHVPDQATKSPPGTIPDTGWVLPDKGGYPVLDTAIRPILAGLVKLHFLAPKTDRPALYSRLDLGDPGKTAQSHAIELTDPSGAEIVKLIIGKRKDPTPGGVGDAAYIRKPGDPKTWLAAPAIKLPEDELAWIDRKILDIDAAKIKEIVIAPADGKPLDLARDKAEDPLAIKALPKDAKLKSENPGSEIAAGFRYLDLADVAPVAKVTEPPKTKVEVTGFDGLIVDLALSDHDGGVWTTVAASGSGDAAKEAAEISGRTKGWVYKISDEKAKTLRTTLADLLEKPAEPAKPPVGKTKPATP